MYGDNRSEYRDFKYEYNKKYVVKTKLEGNYHGEINKRFHSYTSREKAREKRIIVRKFIIPKGSLYLFNKYKKEYVSNQIKMVKAKT